MDSNNWRPAQPDPPPNNMDAGDWRSQLQPDSRHGIVNKIMETLKRHLPFSGEEGLLEVKKIAVRFEEKIYSAATSQSDYLQKISLKMLTMETKSQSTIAGSLATNSAGSNRIPMEPASIDSASQSGHANSADWQEEVYKKIAIMKEKYFPQISDLFQKISLKLQQHESLPQPPKPDQHEKLMLFKSLLVRIITFLQVSKMNVDTVHREKWASYEKQIVTLLNSNRPKNKKGESCTQSSFDG